MKKFIFAALILGAVAYAQQGPATADAAGTTAPAATVSNRLAPATQSDIYCAGFLTKQEVSRTNLVVGGLKSPDVTRFVRGDLIFLKGSYQPGDRVSIVREYQSPDRFDIYKGQKKLLEEAGQPYFDLGFARVLEIRGEGIAVAKVDLSCDTIVPGDLIMPFVERPQVMVRGRSTMDRFPAGQPSLTGKVVMVGESDQLATVGKKLFLNLGWQKGVKVGDYFRITRDYDPANSDEADQGTYGATELDDTQKNPLKLKKKDYMAMPRHVLGEVVILNATQTSSTAMVTFMLDEIHAGDNAEREEPAH